MRRAIITAGLAALALGACAHDPYGGRFDDRRHGNYAYDGEHWRDRGTRMPYEGELTGPGLAILDPWLLETREGRAVVTLGFSDAAEGFVSEDTAHRANIWFRRYADENGDMRITDPEIRIALVAAAGPYLR